MINWILIITVHQLVTLTHTHAQAVYTNPVTLLSCHNYSSMSTKHVRQHVTFILNVVKERDRGVRLKAAWAAIEEPNLA